MSELTSLSSRDSSRAPSASAKLSASPSSAVHPALSVLEEHLDALITSHTNLKRENQLLEQKLRALQNEHSTLLKTHEAAIAKVTHITNAVREQIKQL